MDVRKSFWIGLVGLAAIAYDVRDHPRLHAPFDAYQHRTEVLAIGRNCDSGQVNISGTLGNRDGRWSVIEDHTHQSHGIAAVETDAFAVTVVFETPGQRIVSIVAVPDEALARQGYFVGASVGLDRARLSFARAGLTGARPVAPKTVRAPLSNIWIHGVLEADCNTSPDQVAARAADIGGLRGPTP